MTFAEPVAAFGRTLGIEALTLDYRGVTQLLLDEGRALTLEATDEELLLYLAAPAPFVELPRLAAALAAANARRLDGPALQLGLRGTGADAMLIVLTRLAGRALSGSDIARAADHIFGWHAAWQAT